MEVPISQLVAMFCNLDDFCKGFEPISQPCLLHHALAMARSQHAKAWELHTATTLAGLWLAQGMLETRFGLRDIGRHLTMQAPVQIWRKQPPVS